LSDVIDEKVLYRRMRFTLFDIGERLLADAKYISVRQSIKYHLLSLKSFALRLMSSLTKKRPKARSVTLVRFAINTMVTDKDSVMVNCVRDRLIAKIRAQFAVGQFKPLPKSQQYLSVQVSSSRLLKNVNCENIIITNKDISFHNCLFCTGSGTRPRRSSPPADD
jgi:hypothetical protein